MAKEQWGFFSVPQLLWPTVTRVFHLWWPVTRTPVAERLAVVQSLPVFTTEVCPGLDSNTQPSACKANANGATPAVTTFVKNPFWSWFYWASILYSRIFHRLQRPSRMQYSHPLPICKTCTTQSELGFVTASWSKSHYILKVKKPNTYIMYRQIN